MERIDLDTLKRYADSELRQAEKFADSGDFGIALECIGAHMAYLIASGGLRSETSERVNAVRGKAYRGFADKDMAAFKAGMEAIHKAQGLM